MYSIYISIVKIHISYPRIRKKCTVDPHCFKTRGKLSCSPCRTPAPQWLYLCSVGENVISKVAWDLETPVIKAIEHFQAFFTLGM